MTVIGYQKMKTPAGVLDIPIFSTDSVENNGLRVEIPGGVVGCYRLTAAGVETPIRVQTSAGIMGISLEESTEPAPSIVDWSNYTFTNASVVQLVEETDEYIQVITPNNGQGIKLGLLDDLIVGKSYNISGRVEILQTVDDRVAVHVRNVTKGSYVKINAALSTAETGTVQNISGTFTPTSSNYTVGDVVELWVVQSWVNSTHDTVEFRIFKDLSLT